jgi:sec-independent protein translocase protein TatA
MFGLGSTELIVLAVLGLLLFGRRLPEVGKNLGKGIVEFKKGLKGVEDEIDQQASRPSTYQQTNALPRNDAQPALQSPASGGAAMAAPGAPVDARVSRADRVE